MGGQWQTYRCVRCPLVIELGGNVCWDESGVVYLETIQVACAGCGTMHRITEERGACRITARPGPARSAHRVRLPDITGEEIEIEEWFAEPDWQPVGSCAGGIKAVGQLPCSCCGRDSRMLSHEGFLYPGGYKIGAPRREVARCVSARWSASRSRMRSEKGWSLHSIAPRILQPLARMTCRMQDSSP
jgi:hypothetical protein